MAAAACGDILGFPSHRVGCAGLRPVVRSGRQSVDGLLRKLLAVAVGRNALRRHSSAGTFDRGCDCPGILPLVSRTGEQADSCRYEVYGLAGDTRTTSEN